MLRAKTTARRTFAASAIAHATWGLPQTIVGLIAFVATHGRARSRFRAAVVTEWRLDVGLSLGLLVFVPTGCPRRLVVHEYGHTLQSLLLGPLYLPVVVLPSLAWAGLPQLRRLRTRKGVSYYSFYTERWANWLGEHVCGEPAMR